MKKAIFALSLLVSTTAFADTVSTTLNGQFKGMPIKAIDAQITVHQSAKGSEIYIKALEECQNVFPNATKVATPNPALFQTTNIANESGMTVVKFVCEGQ